MAATADTKRLCRMMTVRILLRREIRSWVTLPAYHLMVSAFLVVTGMSFHVFAVTMGGKGLLISEITFSGMYFWMAFLALASAVSVKLLGDEQDRGTMELMMTAPVTESQWVVAKALAGFNLIFVPALIAVMYPWMLKALLPEWAGIDVRMWLVGGIPVVLAAGLMTLCGMFWSLVFRRQTAAVAATFLTGMLVMFRGSMRSWIGGHATDGSTGVVAVGSHISSFSAGLIDSRAVVFYTTGIAVLLFVVVRMLQWMRFRRASGGINTVISFLMAMLLAALMNYVAWLHPVRWDVSAGDDHVLPVSVARALKSRGDPVRLILLAPDGDAASMTARRVIEKYRYVNPLLQVEIVDPGTDLARTREVVSRYKIRQSYVLVVECGTRFRTLELRDMERSASGTQRPMQRGATFASALEAELLSALRAVSGETAPVVYFLTGHDERDIADFSDYRGYSEIAAIVRDCHAEVRPLLLDAAAPVTNDCAVLVVAGPARPLSSLETGKIREFLARSGRLMLLLDSGPGTGLESVLAEWGIRLGQDRVVDSRSTGVIPGSRARGAALGIGEVPVVRYGRHQITDGLDGLVTTFVLPRSVEPLSGTVGGGGANDRADKPRVVPLAFSDEQSWAETDLAQDESRFNEGYDRHGPVTVAACVEKGAVSEISMDLKPVRIVVVGDSQFAANRCLAGGNEALFIHSLEWLLDRGGGAVPVADHSGLYSLRMGSDVRGAVFLVTVGLPPLLAVGMALFVLWVRRDKRSILVPASREVGGR